VARPARVKAPRSSAFTDVEIPLGPPPLIPRSFRDFAEISGKSCVWCERTEKDTNGHSSGNDGGNNQSALSDQAVRDQNAVALRVRGLGPAARTGCFLGTPARDHYRGAPRGGADGRCFARRPPS
jgi:hypothetical protein